MNLRKKDVVCPEEQVYLKDMKNYKKKKAGLKNKNEMLIYGKME